MKGVREATTVTGSKQLQQARRQACGEADIWVNPREQRARPTCPLSQPKATLPSRLPVATAPKAERTLPDLMGSACCLLPLRPSELLVGPPCGAGGGEGPLQQAAAAVHASRARAGGGGGRSGGGALLGASDEAFLERGLWSPRCGGVCEGSGTGSGGRAAEGADDWTGNGGGAVAACGGGSESGYDDGWDDAGEEGEYGAEEEDEEEGDVAGCGRGHNGGGSACCWGDECCWEDTGRSRGSGSGGLSERVEFLAGFAGASGGGGGELGIDERSGSAWCCAAEIAAGYEEDSVLLG
ncbi:hypothetical protein MNEG_12937 [Monoraphidium neglectum]|uniref:Uncharacterized protein n=1 Tax=Monoraphidium neglectum TaxID=145388 RepID=A0A0D2MJ48_9CHLO|nr:hypothetical protein MNEG_12937 [Monoraphidium neglectum]KIY95025.1 hypothetical protein MNEG_12937 [Monoraphidium neglectum]|eukprot:XP_013894045.1 hypothetical protein MNEG_12937 [Monoraphidium neglectum]